MAHAEIHETISIPADKFFKAITDYAHYPDFVTGCSGAEVLKTEGDGAQKKIQVLYKVSLMKDISYSLEHTQDSSDASALKMSWRLMESSFVKQNTGFWELKAVGPERCEINYEINIDFNFPVPGFVLKKLIQGGLPAMLKNFEKRALQV